jgi:putative nucleotidyltransferase with HDIG domain
MTATSTSQEMIMNACDLPAVPDVAQRVMEIMADPNSNTPKICKAISVDPALTTRILKISNSAFYGCLRTINNLHSAIVIIGFNAIRSLVIAVSTREVYKNFGLTERMLWEHSVGVGIAAHILANKTKISKADDVFVCGLLHDIGKVIMNNDKNELFLQVMEKTYNEHIPSVEAEQEIFGFTHAEVGAMVIKKWNLTEELEKAVQYHHEIQKVTEEDHFIVVLTSIVNLADQMCHKLGIGTKSPDDKIEIKGSMAASNLGITDDQIDGLLEEIERSCKLEKDIFL